MHRPSKTNAAAGQCYTPSSTWQDTEKNTHQSHEIRLSTPDDWRIRAIGGLYYEQFIIHGRHRMAVQERPDVLARDRCELLQQHPAVAAGPFTSDPSIRNDNVGFFNNFQRTIDQKAAFGSVDFDIIPKISDLDARAPATIDFNESEIGGNVGSFNCEVYTPTNLLWALPGALRKQIEYADSQQLPSTPASGAAPT